jgi:hypothetical protein
MPKAHTPLESSSFTKFSRIRAVNLSAQKLGPQFKSIPELTVLAFLISVSCMPIGVKVMASQSENPRGIQNVAGQVGDMGTDSYPV